MEPWTMVGWCLLLLLALPVGATVVFYALSLLVFVIAFLWRLLSSFKVALLVLLVFALLAAVILASGGAP